MTLHSDGRSQREGWLELVGGEVQASLPSPHEVSAYLIAAKNGENPEPPEGMTYLPSSDEVHDFFAGFGCYLQCDCGRNQSSKEAS